MSPFVLTLISEFGERVNSNQEQVPLVLGENSVYHHPEDCGSDSIMSSVHAYLKRLLISTTVPDTVVLISNAVTAAEAEQVPRGFQPKTAAEQRTLLAPGQQYSAVLGDRIEFLDSGMLYLVQKQLLDRAPVRVKANINSDGVPISGTKQDVDSVELYMTIGAEFATYVPKSMVQRAQFQQLFCSDIASCLSIREDSVEFIDCHPIRELADEQMTEVVFLLLAADTARGRNSQTHQNSHLGPRVLAAELAVLVADPDSKLHKTLTLRKAVALKFRIGGKQLRKDLAHNAPAVDMLPEYGGDDSSTATTLSEDSDDDDSQNLQPTHGKPRLTAHEARSARRDSSNIWAPVTQDERAAGAVHPLRTVEGRLATFGGWTMHKQADSGGSHRQREQGSLSLALSPLSLARAGFYRIDDPEHFHTVRCAYCRMEMANLRRDHPPPMIMHKKGSPQCPLVTGSVTEKVGLSFQKREHESEQGTDKDKEEEEQVSEHEVADGSADVSPEQEDLIAMAKEMGAKVLRGENLAAGDRVDDVANAMDTPQEANVRGPKNAEVRAMVYRQLERRAERVARLPQPAPPASRKRDIPSPSKISLGNHADDTSALSRLEAGEMHKPAQVNSMKDRGRESGPELSALELIDIFKTLDINGDGEVSHAEFIKGLKGNPRMAERLGMPSEIRAEDGNLSLCVSIQTTDEPIKSITKQATDSPA